MSKYSNRIQKKSASIITISQLNRFDCLLNLYELIKLQTYTNITEWVIVEGSKNKEDGEKNKENINTLLKMHSKLSELNPLCIHSQLKIVYIEYTGLLLSDLRNLGNNKCSGKIIVCMDDDDYYPPERVSHAVNMLVTHPNALCAGASEIYIWFNTLNKMYRFGPYGPNHSTAGTFAFKRELLKQTSYENDALLEI
jgi:glycosyltransferase involved in cell wall biosynthesis